MKHLKQYLSCFLVIAMLISTVNISNAVEFDNYENEQEQVEVSESIESLQDETMEIESSETDLNVFDEFDSLLEENKNTDISLLSIQKGSQTVNTGSGGRYNWKEIIVYHSNYPNAEDVEFIVYYNIQHLVNFYSTGQLEVFNALGFEIPDGYELKKVIWNTKADGTGKGYINSFAFDIKNNNKATHLYAQYELQHTHSYSWIKTKNPTCYEDGEEIYTCNCGAINNRRAIPASLIYHTYGKWYNNGNGQMQRDCNYNIHHEYRKMTNYIVQYYDTEGNTIKQDITRTGVIGDIISVSDDDKILDGYVFDEENEGNILEETLTESGTVLILYFIEEDYSNFYRYQLNFDFNGGIWHEKESHTETQKFKDSGWNLFLNAKFYPHPEKEGYIFDGWDYEGNGSYDEDENSVFMEGILGEIVEGTLTARWRKEDIKPNNTFNLVKTFEGIDNIPENFEMKYNVICENTAEGTLECNGVLTYENGNVNLEEKTITWKVPYFYGYSNNINIITLTEINADVDGYIYYPFNTLGSTSILEDNTIQINLSSMASGATRKFSNIYENENLKVTWYDEDKTTILDTNTFLANSAEPEFNGITPKKEKDENYTYNFLQWAKQDIPLNDDDVSYIAEYEKIPIEKSMLQIEKTVNKNMFYHSEIVDYKIKVLNIGNITAKNVIITDILDVNLLYVNSEINGKEIKPNLGRYFIGDIKPNEEIILNLSVKIKNNVDFGTEINNTASVVCENILENGKLQDSVNIIIIDKQYGSYIVNHKYYTKDKAGNLILDKTVSDKPVTLESGTILNTYTIEQKPEADYNFSEISEDSITIEADIQKTVTIKYIREEKYGSYVVRHEYYVKDKNGNLTLENTISENPIEAVSGTIIKADELNQILNNNNKTYEFSEHSGNITIEESSTKEIVFKYIREEKYGSYQVKHEYYIRDKEGNVSLEDVKEEDTISDIVVGTLIKSNEQKQYLEFNKNTYSLLEETNDVIIEENKVFEIIFKYVREKEYGTYVIKHNYYIKDKDSNFILEESISEEPILTEPGTIIGLEDADVVIPKKLKDGYIFKDSSENMVIETNKETEFIINYFREEPVALKYGSYQVVHQYYLDDNLDATVTEEIVPDVLVGTSVGVADADIIVLKKENYDNKEYVFDSADKVIIKENETVILIIKYIRESQQVIEPVSVSITAIKELKNASLKENKGFVLPCKPNQFSFKLTNNIDTYIASNDANGNVIFKPITFNKEGTYKYYLTEDNTKETNIKYDESVYEIEITVSNIENRLNASIRCFKDGKEVDTLHFINIYEQPKEIEQKPDNSLIQNETITIIPEEEPPKTIIKQPQKQNKNNGLVEIEDEVVPKSMKPIQTGDDSQIFMYVIILIVSGFGLVFIKKKKK